MVSCAGRFLRHVVRHGITEVAKLTIGYFTICLEVKNEWEWAGQERKINASVILQAIPVTRARAKKRRRRVDGSHDRSEQVSPGMCMPGNFL